MTSLSQQRDLNRANVLENNWRFLESNRTFLGESKQTNRNRASREKKQHSYLSVTHPAQFSVYDSRFKLHTNTSNHII